MGLEWGERLARLADELGSEVKQGEPMAQYTSFRIGGPADLLIRAKCVPELVRSVLLAKEWGGPHLILGAGTNILVSDEGVCGLVVVNSCAGFREIRKELDGRCSLWVESGVRLPSLVSLLGKKGLSGLEWAVGIPGTVGGAVVVNAGAFGRCFADSLSRLEVMELDGTMHMWGLAELRPGYRTSALRTVPGGRVVTRMEMVLEAEKSAQVEKRLAEYRERRRASQPCEPSAGSIFKNPSEASAGWLVEQVGLKGLAKGDAQISPRHANFIVNRGRARAFDVLYLIQTAKERVYSQFGIELELEIDLIGLAEESAPMRRR